mmetsp:Transcript_37266/g.68741  ORF Transcript_37266/g.68741 Transcript_37266/m.68741 type:complete len:109 (+) Transcript_37266:531-857(+)
MIFHQDVLEFSYCMRACVRVRCLSHVQVLGQMDHEIYTDKGHHINPRALKNDDSILNCCLFFSRNQGSVVHLCTADKNLLIRAKVEQVQTIEKYIDAFRYLDQFAKTS